METQSISTNIYIEDHDLEVEADYDLQPAEKETGESGFSLGYPGCSASIEGIYDITCVDKDAELVKKFNKKMKDETFVKYIECQIEEAIWESLSE